MTNTGTIGRVNSEGSNLIIECVKPQTDFPYCGMIHRGWAREGKQG